MVRIAHLSTAHGRRELRIHLKECNTLAANGYDVHYFVADGLGDERVGDVHVHDIGRAGGRLQRMLVRPWHMLSSALKLDAQLYHFHDPELLLIALFLLRGGAKVIYDSHEDVPRSLLSRDWISPLICPIVSVVFQTFENFITRRLSAIVGATPHITARFAKLNPHSVSINNFPLRGEILDEVDHRGDPHTVCYIGGIGRVRGIEEMVRALEHVDMRLILAGPFENAETEQAMRALPGWSKVDYRGKVSRVAVRQILAESQSGLILFHPEPNHINALPNKMFEYMSAAQPVIASDFPLWRDIITRADCGICVDPTDVQAIVVAIEELAANTARAREMGQNGRRAVQQNYNWDNEAKKLLAMYDTLLPDRRACQNKQ